MNTNDDQDFFAWMRSPELRWRLHCCQVRDAIERGEDPAALFAAHEAGPHAWTPEELSALQGRLDEEAAKDEFTLTCELRNMGHQRAGARRRPKVGRVKIKLRRDGRAHSGA